MKHSLIAAAIMILAVSCSAGARVVVDSGTVKLPPRIGKATVGSVDTTKRAAARIIELIEKEKCLNAVVGQLVRSGKFCKAWGHTWKDGCGITGCIHPAPLRHCLFCGASQTLFQEWR